MTVGKRISDLSAGTLTTTDVLEIQTSAGLSKKVTGAQMAILNVANTFTAKQTVSVADGVAQFSAVATTGRLETYAYVTSGSGIVNTNGAAIISIDPTFSVYEPLTFRATYTDIISPTGGAFHLNNDQALSIGATTSALQFFGWHVGLACSLVQSFDGAAYHPLKFIGTSFEVLNTSASTVFSVNGTTGKATTLASASGSAGFNLPHGAAPSSPVNGDIWTTTAGLFVRINGATVGPLS